MSAYLRGIDAETTVVWTREAERARRIATAGAVVVALIGILGALFIWRRA